MYFVPLIYFSGLTYYFWQRHKTFDVAVYMSSMFTITSLCAVLMVLSGHMEGSGVLFDGWEPEFGVIPTFLYCGLVSVTIYPFSFIRVEKLKTISNTHQILIFGLTLLVLLIGFVVLYLVGSSVSDLLRGDFKDMKNAHYMGDISAADVKMLTMPAPVQLLYLLAFVSQFGIPLYFYYTCVKKWNAWLCLPLLLASVSPIARGILVADRTEIINFGLIFIFNIVLFQKLITKQVRNTLLILGIPAASLVCVYFMAVSLARFEDENEGASGSLLEYTGQSYANFCYFYENHNSDLYYFERETPILSYFLFKRQYNDTKEERSAREGFFVGVFASHVGSWLLDVGVIGCAMLSALFALITALVIGRYNREEFDIAEVFVFFVLATVPLFGIFYYRYYQMAIALQYLTAFLFYFASKFVLVWRGNGSGGKRSIQKSN